MTDKLTRTDSAPLVVLFANRIIKGMLLVGTPMRPMILLTVRGRKTGLPRTTPVGLFELDSRRYLFSTFGESQWVRNLRAAGEAILSHDRRKEAVVAVEMPPEEAAPVLKSALEPFLASPFAKGMLRSWYGVTLETPLEGFVDVARHHPVFALREPMLTQRAGFRA